MNNGKQIVKRAGTPGKTSRRLLPGGKTPAGRRIPASAALFAALCLWVSPAWAQATAKGAQSPSTISLVSPPTQTNAGPPLTLTLADALARAQKNSPQFQAAVTAAKLAKQNQVQARAAMLPSVDNLTQYLNTQGDGISPVGRFVTNDGIHVYREWATVHQAMPGSFFIDAGPRLAAYQAAVATADREIALRGLNVTITQDYYALVAAQRGYGIAQQALASAQRFLSISRALEQGGEVADSDVIRFQLQVNQNQRALQNAKLAMSQARLNLSVLLFPSFNENFTVVDDLNTPPVLPTFSQAKAMASTHNPQLAAALGSYHAAGVNVAIARSAFFPSLSVDFDYGIEANAFALHSVNTTKPGVVQPNLGYFVTYSMDIPVWDWGARLSRLRQAKDSRALARLNLSFAQRQLLSNLYSYYNQAATDWNQLTSLRQSVDLAEHNLQLVTMQYQAGETTVLQVLDAETSLVSSRTSYVTGEQNYRNAVAALQTVTGSF